MTLTTQLLSEHGQRTAYRIKGEGEPLVLLHGVGMQSAAWGPQIEHLSRDYQVIALDMPGHGASDSLPAGSKLSDYVAWCCRTIECLGLGPVNLAGHSMGALIAGGVAATSPDLLLRVALLNGVFRRSGPAGAAVQARAADIHGGTIDIDTPLERWFGDEHACARASVADWLNEVDPGGYATAYTAFAHGDADYAEQLANIACPFLALTGDGDANSTPVMSQQMADLAQDGVAVVIKGHRHMVNLTAPSEVNAHLRAWLARPVGTEDM